MARVLALALLSGPLASALTLSSDECRQCGSSTCFSSVCRAGVCGTAFVREKYESFGFVVNMPSPCEEGPYTCSEDEEDASLLCNAGTCAFDAPCAPPRRGDVRLQPTELSQLLELRLGQVPSVPPSGLLMVYGMAEPNRWSIACADASPDRDRAADVVCRQLGFARAVSSKMVAIEPLLTRLSAAFAAGSGSLSDGVATFSRELRTLYGDKFGHLSSNALWMHACPGNASAGIELPSSILECTGPPLVLRSCSRTNALHVSCAAELRPPPPLPPARSSRHGSRKLPEPTAACGSSSVSKLLPCPPEDDDDDDARADAREKGIDKAATRPASTHGAGKGAGAPNAAAASHPAAASSPARVCPSLFLPNPQAVAGGIYCVHYPMHAAVSPQQREQAFRARVAAGLTRGASSAPLPADSEAAADEESARACQEALASGDLGATMDRCSAASGFAHPAAAAALAQAYASGANEAAAKAAAEEAGIAGLNALLAASMPPPADPLAGVVLPPVMCYLGQATEGEAAAAGWDSSALLQVAGAPANAGNATPCESFDTRAHCPSDRWAAVLLPSGAYFCAGTAPALPPPPAGLSERARAAAGIFKGAPLPFVLCHQTGPNALSIPACVPRTEPELSSAVTSAIGIHLDPRPQARAPAQGAAGSEPPADCSLELAAVVTEQGLAPAGCARAPLAPELCAAGVYCPNLFNRAVCPAGHFCWQGSTQPAPCDRDLLGGILASLFAAPLGALLGAVPAGAKDACPAGTERPPPRTDFVIVVGLVFGGVLLLFALYDRLRAAHQVALLALGEDSGAAQRSTAALYVQLDALYARAALVLAPALTPRTRRASDKRLSGMPERVPLSWWQSVRLQAEPFLEGARQRADALVDMAPGWARTYMRTARVAASDAADWARTKLGHSARAQRGESGGGGGGAGAGGAGGGAAAPGNGGGGSGAVRNRLYHSAFERGASHGTAHGGSMYGDDDDEVVVPPAMAASVERARRRQAEGLAAIHPDSEESFAKFPDRISFQFKRLGMKVRAPAAVVARRRRAAAERAAERAAGRAGGARGARDGHGGLGDTSGWMEVLHSVSGSIEHSTLTAIMGVSGCGKSSFMNVLCGRAQYGLPTGQLRVNNAAAEPERYRNRMGYVPQDDTVREALTVYENILFAARLRLPRGTREARVRGLTHEVIEMLGLQSVRDSVVGSAEVRGISGGQRKRVNIGIELAADPIALFLDEPTSGLDACTAELVLSALRSLARRGRTVVMVLHQPRYTAFKLLDRLILLGVGGRTLFCGEPLKVVPYFASVGYTMRYGENPADFMLDVVSGLVPRDPKRSYERAERERTRGAASMDGRGPPGGSTDGRGPPGGSMDGRGPPGGSMDGRGPPSPPRFASTYGSRRPSAAPGGAASTATWRDGRGGHQRLGKWAPGGQMGQMLRVSTLPGGGHANFSARGAQVAPQAGGGASGGLPREPSSPTTTAETSEPHTAPRASRQREAAAPAPKRPGPGMAAAGGVATTAVLAECWAALGHTISAFENEAAPVTALFTQEQQLAVLRVFDATLEAAWPYSEREHSRDEQAAVLREISVALNNSSLSAPAPARAADVVVRARASSSTAVAAGGATGGAAAGGGAAGGAAAGGSKCGSCPCGSSNGCGVCHDLSGAMLSAYIFRDVLEQVSAGVVLPAAVPLSQQPTAVRARNRWHAAARAVAISRRPESARATLAIRRIGQPLHVRVGGSGNAGQRSPRGAESLGAAAVAATGSALPLPLPLPSSAASVGGQTAEPTELAAELNEGAGEDDDDADETASLPDIPAPPACHTRSRRLARGHPMLERQLAEAASAGSLAVGDWAAFMQALQDLASMSVITRAQVDLVAACLHEQLLRASDASGRPLVDGMGPSAPVSPGGSVAEVADEDDLADFELNGEDAPPAADELLEWDFETAAEAVSVVFTRAELEALLRITDDNSVESILELQRNGELTASEYFEYQSDVNGLSEAEIWAKWSRLQQQQLAGETPGVGSVGIRARRPSHLDFAAVGASEASRRVQSRESPSFLGQLGTLTAAYAAQQRRLASGLGATAEWAALVLVAAFVGILQRSQLPESYEKLPTIYVLVLTLYSLFVALPSVRTFTFDRHSFWREASAGISPTAFYCSRALADLPGLSLRALLFALVFWSCAFWSGSLSVLIWLLLAVMLCASGLAYVIAITVPASLAVTVCGVLICSLCGFFAGIVPTIHEAGPAMRLTLDLSYGRWAAQCIASADFLEIPNALYAEQGRQLIALFAWPSAEQLAEAGRGPCSQPIGVLVLLGVLLRVLGCIAINYANGTQFGRAPLCNPAPRAAAMRHSSRRATAKGSAARARTSRKPLLLGPAVSRASSSMM